MKSCLVCVFFFRGEVIAKADHTEQILYSDIGKLLLDIIDLLGCLGHRLLLVLYSSLDGMLAHGRATPQY